MYRHNLAYRHKNGQVEGFSAFRFNKQNAEIQARNAVRQKCLEIGEDFNPERLITSFDGLTESEKKTIEQDWKTH